MASEIWRRLGRWLLAAAICIVGLLPAIIFLELSSDWDRGLMRVMDVLSFHLPAEICLWFVGIIVIFIALTLWILPAAIAVGFALRAPLKSRIEWGLTLSLLFICAYVWWANAPGARLASQITALSVSVLLICGIIFRSVRKQTTNLQFVIIVVAAVCLTLPDWIALSFAPPEPPTAQQLRSVTLQKSFWQGMNTGSAYNARRQVIFAGDRLVVSFDAGSAPYQGNQPMSNYRLLSLDVRTGDILNSKEFTRNWAEMPLLYATNDGHAIVQHPTLKFLNADLSDTGKRFDIEHGRVSAISPDGSTMVWETNPGSTLIDASTLTPLPEHLDESNPTSVGKHAVVTDNDSWNGMYPNDHAFVTLTDETGEHMIFHAECGGRPEFLTNEKVIVAGCGKIRIINTHGDLLRETNSMEGVPTFAGASRDGSRFAIEFSEIRGDPPMPLYDHFVIYDTETAKPLAIIRIADLPEFNSWSALSADGKMFAAGNPNDLRLYRIP